MEKKKKIIILSIVIGLILLVLGGTYAYWEYYFEKDTTSVTFTVVDGLACMADGGGSITSDEMQLIPTYCDNSPYVLKKEINVRMISSEATHPYLNMWLDVKSISNELSNSANLRWVLSSSSTSCEYGRTYASGTFQNKHANDRVNILVNNIYPDVIGSTYRKYYLYIWLDVVETNNATQNGSFKFELGGECNNQEHQLSPSDLYHDNILNGNDPVLVDGLIPVSFGEEETGASGTITVADPTDIWYSYGDKKWANAVLVREEAVDCDRDGTCFDHDREYYQNNPGVEISEIDILAYYVWIPRYSYQVWAYTGNDSPGDPHEIPIRFVNTNTIDNATKIGDWFTHPAFWWDDDSDKVRESGEELSGIWVGKFEISHNTLSNSTTVDNLGTDSGGTICNSTGCANYAGLRILPGVKSLRYNRISNFFNASRFMESVGNPFGLNAATVDSHIIKASEWGAVAYLSYSKFGINSSIRKNGNSNYYTGSGFYPPGGSSNYTTSLVDSYGTQVSYPQSTTGNVTGIFDTSGGSYEMLMSVYDKRVALSGFSSATYPLPDEKYYDYYPASIFGTANSVSASLALCTLEYCGGRAIYETYSWDGSSNNYSWFTNGSCSTCSWNVFGGYFATGNTNLLYGNLATYAPYPYGSAQSTYSSRLILIANNE